MTRMCDLVIRWMTMIFFLISNADVEYELYIFCIGLESMKLQYICVYFKQFEGILEYVES